MEEAFLAISARRSDVIFAARAAPPFPAERPRRRVFPVILGRVVNLSRRHLSDHDGAGVYVGGRFSPLGPRGIKYPL